MIAKIWILFLILIVIGSITYLNFGTQLKEPLIVDNNFILKVHPQRELFLIRRIEQIVYFNESLSL